MATFFTADTHFGHAGARALYRRPFATVADMDAAMIERWNAAVAPADTVFHLGDFAVRHPDPAAMLAALNGQKHLITGNNDAASVTALPWASISPYAEIVVESVALVLCHYAFRTWAGMGKGAWNLHGHSHGRLKPLPRQVDVGVDAWDFRPVTMANITVSRQRGRGAVSSS
jgi:calcineurin-like phosphoesterase family protein